MRYLIPLYIFFSALYIYPQQKSEMITVIGDSLVGSMSGGETIREVYGNVVMTQGDLRITCDHAVQYISRNDAKLIGNVVATQDSLTITTSEGFYFGDERIAKSDKGVKLDDQKVILTARNGEYFFNEDRAYFLDSVTLYDTVTTLTSSELTYFKEENRAVAVGNVKIVDSVNTIIADTLEHFRDSRITIADQNVKISSSRNSIEIYGDHLEDYPSKEYTLINDNPLLIQIDTIYTVRVDTLDGGVIDSVETGMLDTLAIKSMFMEAFRDSLENKFIAKDSVLIVKGGFASKNDLTTYFRNEETIITKRLKRGLQQPVIWYDNSQLTGDSVAIYLNESKIKNLHVIRDAFILSQNEMYKDRFDQISGDSVHIQFDDGGISMTEVFGGVLSIYYMYDKDEANGLIKSSSQSTKIKFENKKVNQVRLYGQPASEYYPEPQVLGKELSFTLPRYIYYKDRPVKEDLIKDLAVDETN